MISALDSATERRALSLLRSPPNTGKYEAIKTLLTSAYELSDYERASSLFRLTGLGYYKSSKLMDSMLTLLGDHNPCFLFNHLFLQQLPDFVRGSLANSVINDYRSFAQEAEKISY